MNPENDNSNATAQTEPAHLLVAEFLRERGFISAGAEVAMFFEEWAASRCKSCHGAGVIVVDGVPQTHEEFLGMVRVEILEAVPCARCGGACVEPETSFETDHA